MTDKEIQASDEEMEQFNVLQNEKCVSVKKEKLTGKGVKADNGKPDWSLVELKAIEGMVEVLTFGVKKYAPDNWKKVPDAKKRYFAALIRHLTAWQNGELVDPESGKSHLDHAMCNLYFLKHFDQEK